VPTEASGKLLILLSASSAFLVVFLFDVEDEGVMFS
jgi:hypothetical protein